MVALGKGQDVVARTIDAGLAKKVRHALLGDAPLVGLVPSARHTGATSATSKALPRKPLTSHARRALVKRAANVWDRFYHDHEAPWRGERAVAELLPWLGDTVIELGCGNGKTLRPLLAAGLHVIGVDISFNILRRLPPCDRVLADVSRLPLAHGCAESVLDLHCTTHLSTAARRDAWKRLHAVLIPSGTLIVERLAPDDLRASQGEAVPDEPWTRQVADGRMTQFAPPEEIVREVEDAGFHLVGGCVERFHPGHRGRLVTRSSIRLVFAKPVT